jgi:phage terminase small subunit
MAKTSKKTEIKTDLLQQLEANGTRGKHYVDMVEDYMILWNVKNKLAKECKKRKLIKWKNGENQQGEKPNPALKEFHETNKRMTDLLKSLGLEAPLVKDEVPDEEL